MLERATARHRARHGAGMAGAGVPRDLLRWLLGLDLAYPVKNVRRCAPPPPPPRPPRPPRRPTTTTTLGWGAKASGQGG